MYWIPQEILDLVGQISCRVAGSIGETFLPWFSLTLASLVAQMVKRLPAMWETQVQSLGWEDLLEVAQQPTPYSCLENPMDRGAWRTTVHGVANSQTRLSE